MREIGWRFIKLILGISIVWLLLTLWAEKKGQNRLSQFGAAGKLNSALIVYDPDPFYNLDQQICESFGRVLADSGFAVTIATVSAVKALPDSSTSLYVFCANTYNWYPDKAISSFVRNHPHLAGKSVVAITLGAGSTGHSQQIFEGIIKDTKANLVGSKTYWLWKPNDKTRMKESNVKVAVELVRKWAMEMTAAVKR